MNLAHQFKQFFIILGTCASLLAIAPATASVIGSMIFDITDGCFSTTGGSECGNTDGHAVFASGNFTFTDTLSPLNPSTKDYSYTAKASIDAVDPDGVAKPFSDSLSQSFANFGALIGDENWKAALGVFNAVISGNPIVGPGGAFTIFFAGASIVGDSTAPGGVSGSFTAWSSDLAALNQLSNQLFDKDLPQIPVDFTAHAELNALVSEPMSLALLGLGIAAIVSIRSRQD